ncbi:pimeloyl-ACP methyl ester carboxylesterase [Prauserella isguenensis]|uniref:Pimeloyl-ACP methyl ester carboxylesterase n=1 Tax=Prauserella isguenensis TaxID=1470180 RepID=A0A839S7V3_9PSEU|nr:alpha/beta hydrolase [Prauserella isguenensis]MBB3052789.1 pimeloyl-ACP methyl ester carboxylesterase [Prauserella isguenensis]
MTGDPRTTAFSQLSPHGGTRIDLPGGIAALSGPEPADVAGTALLVPGYTGSKEDFAPLLDGIADGGLHPLAIDLPGQYESPGPDDETAYLPDRLGEVVAELITALDGPVLLLGHSYGGLVSRGAVLAGAPVAGLTLLDSGPSRLPHGLRTQALEAGEPLLRTQGVEAVYAIREQLGGLPAAELREFLRRRFVNSAAAGLLGMARGLRSEPDRTEELAAALGDRPALVVTGERDDAWPVDLQKDMARRLAATFTVVPRAAHSPNTENPHFLLDVLLTEWHTWL